MLSIAPLASPDYYLGAAVSSGEAFNYFADDGHAESYPLKRHGRWLGKLSAEVGLVTHAGKPSAGLNGVPVTAADFDAIKYGLHPATGRPLRSDGGRQNAPLADMTGHQSVSAVLRYCGIAVFSKRR